MADLRLLGSCAMDGFSALLDPQRDVTIDPRLKQGRTELEKVSRCRKTPPEELIDRIHQIHFDPQATNRIQESAILVQEAHDPPKLGLAAKILVEAKNSSSKEVVRKARETTIASGEEVRTLRAILLKAESEKATSHEAVKSLEERAAALEVEKTELNEQIHCDQDTIAELRRQLRENETQYKAKEAKREEEQAANSSELATLREERDEAVEFKLSSQQFMAERQKTLDDELNALRKERDEAVDDRLASRKSTAQQKETIDNLKCAGQEKDQRIEALRQKRIRDRAYIQELKAANKNLSNEYDEMERELKAQLSSKGEEIQKAKDDHTQKFSELVKAAEVNRKAAEEKKASLEADIELLKAEIKDNETASKQEMDTLAHRIVALEHELELQKKSRQPRVTNLRNMTEYDRVAEDYAKLRKLFDDQSRDLKWCGRSNEDLLEHIQLTSARITEHMKKEEAARKEAIGLEYKVVKLQEQLARKEEQNRVMVKQIAQWEQGSAQNAKTPNGSELPAVDTTMTDKHLITSKKDFDVLGDTLRENEQLRYLLEVEQDEKQKLQDKLDKADNDDLEMTMKVQSIEAELNESKEMVKTLQETRVREEKRMEILEMAKEKNEKLSPRDKGWIRKQLKDVIDENKELKERQRALEGEHTKAKVELDTIKDKMNSEYMKLRDRYDNLESAYFDEAVSKTEALHQKISELMAEKGENYFVEGEHPYNQIVADRNALRYACIKGLEGLEKLPRDIVPPQVFEAGFWPGCIPATLNALARLRPLGWRPIYDLEKVYLTPMVQRYTDIDALDRARAEKEEDRMAHRAAMGYPVSAGYQQITQGVDAATKSNETSTSDDAKGSSSTGASAPEAVKPTTESPDSSIPDHEELLGPLDYDDLADNFSSRYEYEEEYDDAQKKGYQAVMAKTNRNKRPRKK